MSDQCNDVEERHEELSDREDRNDRTAEESEACRRQCRCVEVQDEDEIVRQRPPQTWMTKKQLRKE